MKRSQINGIISDAKAFFEEMNFKLPRFGYWKLDEWQQNKAAAGEIFTAGMGWDITSFGHEDFYEQGLVLFTLRNGMEKDGELVKMPILDLIPEKYEKR